MALLFLVLAVGNRNLPLSTASVSTLALFRLLWHYLYLEIRSGEAVVRNGFAVHRFCLDDGSTSVQLEGKLVFKEEGGPLVSPLGYQLQDKYRSKDRPNRDRVQELLSANGKNFRYVDRLWDPY